MGKSTQVSWQVLLEDDDWNSDQVVHPPFEPSAQREPAGGRLGKATGPLLGICVLVVVLAAFYLWRLAQAGVAQIEAELHETMTLEAWTVQSHAATAELERVDLRTGQAMAQVRVFDPQRPFPYQEIRFYQQTPSGWQRSAPDADFWGSAKRLESDFFIFNFRQRDGLTVTRAAPELDKLYRQMHEMLGLPLHVNDGADEKIHVTLAVEEVPLGSLGYFDRSSLTIPSPLLRPRPEHLSETDLLVESVAFPLRYHLVAAAVGPLSIYAAPTQELVAGLHQWLTWETGGLLAEYRTEVVRWLYADAPGGPHQVPNSYTAICQTIDLVGISFTKLTMPFSCSEASPLLPSHIVSLPNRLGYLPLTVPMEMAQHIGQSYDLHMGALPDQRLGRGLVIATILEYAVEDYGPATIPLLLQAVNAGSSWYQAAPDVFSVSAEAFEAGWHDYLVEEYGLDREALP